MFYFINPQNKTLIAELYSNTPREAALKAASYGVCSLLLIVEVGKIHVFNGTKRLLRDCEQNEFTRSKNIHSKPNVDKILSESIDSNVNPKTKDGIQSVCKVVEELTCIH